jgi:hypothetical protein
MREAREGSGSLRSASEADCSTTLVGSFDQRFERGPIDSVDHRRRRQLPVAGLVAGNARGDCSSFERRRDRIASSLRARAKAFSYSVGASVPISTAGRRPVPRRPDRPRFSTGWKSGETWMDIRGGRCAFSVSATQRSTWAGTFCAIRPGTPTFVRRPFIGPLSNLQAASAAESAEASRKILRPTVLVYST